MLTSLRARLGALAIAAVIAATGGVLTAAPAHAAGATITLANSTFTAGDWGTGLDVTGAGFTPGASVDLLLVENKTWSTLGKTTVSADAGGSFTTVFTPSVDLTVADPDQAVVLGAQSSAGDAANLLLLDIRAPKGISASTTSITPDALADQNAGIDLVASGYDPHEDVVVSGTLNGVTPQSLTAQADRTGTIHVSHLHLSGSAAAGTLVLTATGQTSATTNSITITVTGAVPAPGGAGGTGGTVTGGLGSAAPSATGSAPKLPVVSG